MPMSNFRDSGSYDVDVASGIVDGQSVWRTFGFNYAISSTAFETIWPVSSRWQRLLSDEQFQMTFSGNDGINGTGAQIVRVIGVGPDYFEKDEIIQLNSSPQNMGNWIAINRVVVIASGSLRTNENNIDFTATTSATIQARIPAGYGLTHQIFYTVPRGKQFLIQGVVTNIAKLSGGSRPTITLRNTSTTVNGTQFVIAEVFFDAATQTNVVTNFPNFAPVDEMTSFEQNVISDTTNSLINGNVYGIVRNKI